MGAEIGSALRDARRRLGLEVREVEERTKIRARYIRALESEDWDALPAPAYVRGYLRSYAQLLGLDGDVLADEYRRRGGAEPSGGGPAPPSGSEPVLRERRRGEGPARPRGPLIAAVLAVIVVLLIVVAVIGLGGDGGPTAADGGGKAGKDSGGGGGGGGGRKNRREPIALRLEALTDVKVCLLAGGAVLLDNQLLATGDKEGFEKQRRFKLTLQPGSLQVTAGDIDETLEAQEPASYEVTSKGVDPVSYRGEDCP